MAEVSRADREQFFTTALPYAQDAADRTGLPVSVILAQWGLESKYGTSWIARNGLNFAGIKAGSKHGNQDGTVQAPDGSGPYGAYASWERFVNHWAAILEDEAAYAELREVVADGEDVREVAVALASSPWAQSHYVRDGVPGQGLLDVIEANDLVRFDGATWTGAGFAVQSVGNGYRVEVPGQFAGMAWPAVLIVAGAIGLAAIMGGGNKN